MHKWVESEVVCGMPVGLSLTEMGDVCSLFC